MVLIRIQKLEKLALKLTNSMVPIAMRRSLRRHTRQIILDSAIASRRGQERPAPDFVIVGAQRCGTTSLFRALSKHPALMPNVIDAKGVHYFDTSYHRDSDWYFAHFASRAQRERHAEKVGHRAVVGEASPYYMFHPAVPERMAQTVPDAKLIVLLRNPVKRAISHHLHMVWEGHEPVENIDEALDLEASRLQGVEEQLLKDRNFVSKSHQHHSYIARGRYAEQLERLYTHFDRENVLVMATETLTGDSKTSLARIQSFIGLEPDPAIDLGKKNASSAFTPNPATLERLDAEFAESNARLRDLVDCEIPWLA